MKISAAIFLPLLTCYFVCGVPAHADRPLFAQPPSPEALAALLLPRRYRSADMHAAATSDDTTGFDMMIHFDINSADILPQSLPLLESVGQMLLLKRVGERVVMIAGHADARGTAAYNQALSERRAQTIKSYLVESFDIPPQRLMTVGYGESSLRDANDPLSSVNRRVEFNAAAGISIR